jgi:2-amino-4-hydroxy-6-hydroxymethyldihydropteridine diphosphokinase
MNKAYLLIGGNLGDRLAYLNNAKTMIAAQCGDILHQSSLYETAAWGYTEQPAFINQALLLQTILSADQLLAKLLAIETALGRERAIPMGPRTIDIDIIYFNDEIIKTDHLCIPHPSMQERKFVLIPLNEIAGQFTHPILQKTTQELLSDCTDPCLVNKKNDL